MLDKIPKCNDDYKVVQNNEINVLANWEDRMDIELFILLLLSEFLKFTLVQINTQGASKENVKF